MMVTAIIASHRDDTTVAATHPASHGVQSLKNEAQAKKRCLEDEHNRGTEAARAAVEMANLVAELRK